MTNTNQQEQLYRWVKASERLPDSTEDYPLRINDAFYSGYHLGVDDLWRTDHNETYNTNEVEWLEPYTPPVEDGKQGWEELPDKIKKIIEEESYKEEIYPKKYGSGSRDGYNTMMLYEINSERSECFSKGAEFGYRLAQPSTPVQDGELNNISQQGEQC